LPDVDGYEIDHINKLLSSDVFRLVTRIGEHISHTIFPDRAFSFLLDNDFMNSFNDTFLGGDALFDIENFLPVAKWNVQPSSIG